MELQVDWREAFREAYGSIRPNSVLVEGKAFFSPFEEKYFSHSGAFYRVYNKSIVKVDLAGIQTVVWELRGSRGHFIPSLQIPGFVAFKIRGSPRKYFNLDTLQTQDSPPRIHIPGWGNRDPYWYDPETRFLHRGSEGPVPSPTPGFRPDYVFRGKVYASPGFRPYGFQDKVYVGKNVLTRRSSSMAVTNLDTSHTFELPLPGFMKDGLFFEGRIYLLLAISGRTVKIYQVK